ncbi:MAG: LEA type 2 family protein [Bacteroidales bacterium]|nr:LEA type 2 family protein [Bacteroidales bacterium]
MKSIHFKSLIIISLTLILSSCTQLQQLQNLAKCEFRLNSVENIRLAGVNIQDVKSLNQIGISDVAKLSAAYLGNNLPLDLKLNMDARNPNPTAAALSALDWIFLIDDIEMTRGITNQRFQIPANQTTTIPLLLNFDLKKVLTGKSQNALVNFALNLAGSGNTPTRLALKAKPTIQIGSVNIPYPSYLTIKTDFTSK